MTGTDIPSTSRLADRLLAEVVCLREEAAGHPPDVPQADAAGREAGGGFAGRIQARAAALPDAPALRSAIGQVMRRGIGMALAAMMLAGLSGAFAAAAALNVGPPASLPLVLILLVGSNLLMLLLWLLLLIVSPRITPGLGGWLMTLWRRISGVVRSAPADDPRGQVLALLAGGASGRWFAASLSHAAWLSFSVVAWLSLLLLLSVRAYTLSWDTTLLAPDTVVAWMRALSFGPAILGVSGEHLLAEESGRAIAGASGAYWLLAAVWVYGVLPRVLALLVCGGLWWRAQARFGRNLQRSGYARLRSRLMPDHQLLAVIDSAPPPVPAAITAVGAADWPRGRVRGVWLDDAAERSPPTLPGIEWQWLGAADGVDARKAVLEAVATDSEPPMLVLARATMSPDRGAERFVAALSAVAKTQVHLVLVDMDRLAARGQDNARQRLDDWQALALRAGVESRPLQWPEGFA